MVSNVKVAVPINDMSGIYRLKWVDYDATNVCMYNKKYCF